MAQWIKTSVRFDKTMENGAIKRVTEPYLVDALSFTEAEARIIEEVTPFISGEFTVSAVKKSKVSEIFWDESGDRWYQVKAAFITINEKTGAEKRSKTVFLVQASDFKGAYDNFMQGMKGTMADFEIIGITETAIMDVFKAKLTEE
ncbi:DUF4494 domain-containing protein [Bacteroides xylanisolvens]|uniref:DUF4494 domain-containing protein n=1 Tax=Bacteroides xylanisolvens TaxID=371601 RepID=UPI001CDD741E|nr:DUF4494 domain-containing protein [Bacteroides xylanisolvens]MCA4468140.1 DUF4494 domain-containing protein [Bacteroides xylanisolvens]MCA4472582.1 DUF4494 domain-containing protein [Bacteroides xylanisolvens]MCA4481732.1 DUF4494 domain-containing protein [Bacteroides xylanisolvens]MCA4521557.1 DUF4494 domain-containing protein [Bacteroides xylanisolvens]MCA4558121.1 DUF4494 domain-containing protein [Bacteroides xylanisolvens]